MNAKKITQLLESQISVEQYETEFGQLKQEEACNISEESSPSEDSSYDASLEAEIA